MSGYHQQTSWHIGRCLYFVHVIMMEELLFAVGPRDMHTRPVNNLDCAEVGLAVKPRDALAYF
jgi:hypothetical protein